MSNEEVDDAEQLRFLALQSMIKRSKPNNFKPKTDDVDDQDILLLRAAALKTITTKNSNISLVNNKKRSCQVSPQRNQKNLKLKHEHINDLTNKTFNDKSKETLQYDHKQDVEKYEPQSESHNKSVIEKKDEVKKIVKNGSIQLSNLNSEKVDETMVLHITFSSSESDGSTSECELNNV